MGTWIEIYDKYKNTAIDYGRSLRGNVDRNPVNIGDAGKEDDVVPYVGTWIEMISANSSDRRSGSRSLRGNVDRNLEKWLDDRIIYRRSLRGNVDRNAETNVK